MVLVDVLLLLTEPRLVVLAARVGRTSRSVSRSGIHWLHWARPNICCRKLRYWRNVRTGYLPQ